MARPWWYLSVSLMGVRRAETSPMKAMWARCCTVGVSTSNRRCVMSETRPTRPFSERSRMMRRSASCRPSSSPASAASLRRTTMAFSSWRTRSRVIPSSSPICSSVSRRSLRPKRRTMISRSRSCSSPTASRMVAIDAAKISVGCLVVWFMIRFSISFSVVCECPLALLTFDYRIIGDISQSFHHRTIIAHTLRLW